VINKLEHCNNNAPPVSKVRLIKFKHRFLFTYSRGTGNNN
jgi:hypothetical protein